MFPSSPAFWLAAAMLVLALGNALLMLVWLWRYPMQPDPTARRPLITTAPRAGLWLHRAIGWTFALTWIALAALMLPRLWLHREFSSTGVLHAALGLAVGLLLAAKIHVLRRRPALEHRMPWFGLGLVGLTWAAVWLALWPWWRMAAVAPSAAVTDARPLVVGLCLQCHGATVITAEDEDLRKWRRLVAKMQERAARWRRAPISDAAAESIARWLAQVLPEDGAHEDDDGHQRRRRGRPH